jgi:hypothetical protein
MARSERQGQELGHELVSAIEHDGRIALDLRHLPPATPAALALRSVLARIDGAVIEVQATAPAATPPARRSPPATRT